MYVIKNVPFFTVIQAIKRQFQETLIRLFLEESRSPAEQHQK